MAPPIKMTKVRHRRRAAHPASSARQNCRGSLQTAALGAGGGWRFRGARDGSPCLLLVRQALGKQSR